MIKHVKSISQCEEINVVGNAQSLFSKDFGHLIDKHPTLRFNYIDSLSQQQGTRWDFLACSQFHLIQRYTNPKWHTLLYTRWRLQDDAKILNLKGFKIESVSVELMNKIHSVNKRPSTGLSALFYLDQLGIKCNIFGFDWKETKTYYNTEAKEKLDEGIHNYQSEREIVLRLIDENSWTLY